MSGTNTSARIKAEAVREVAFGAITNTLTALGSPIEFTIKEARFVNTTDADLYFSFYNDLNNIRVAAKSAYTLDLQTNNMAFIPGDIIKIAYVTVPTEGAAWVEVTYT